MFFASDNGGPAHPDVISAGGVYMEPDGSMRASDYASGFASNIYNGRNVPDLSGLVGMRSPDEVKRNLDTFAPDIPADVGAELKHEGVLRADAPTPPPA